MADWFSALKQTRRHLAQSGVPPVILSNHFLNRTWRAASAALVSLSLWVGPSLAKDPFRTTNPKPISDRTEAAFRALFEQGNYPKAASALKQTDPKDPLARALTASLTYLDWDSEKDSQKKVALLEQFRDAADQTQDTAQQLLTADPLRGNIYLAVGHFLEGVYIFSKDGTVKGTPQALGEVQQALKYLNTAEVKSPSDPELNLVKGYVDLFMSLNLPFSSPTKAIDRLDKYASPRYLAYRGIAIGYRDLNQPDKAQAAIEQALKLAPDNPELLYLKAQILAKQGNNRDSIPLFEKALTKKDQLPPGIVKQISRDRDRSIRRRDNVGK